MLGFRTQRRGSMRTDTTDTERLLREGLHLGLRLNGHTNSELAEKLKVQPSWVTAVIKGRHGIAPKHLDAIAQFLGVTVPDLMAGPDRVRQILAERVTRTNAPEALTPAALLPVVDSESLTRLLGLVAALCDFIGRIGGPSVELHIKPPDTKPQPSTMTTPITIAAVNSRRKAKRKVTR